MTWADCPEHPSRALCDAYPPWSAEDPFGWLEDQDSPATRAFLEVERRAYRAYLERHHELRSRIESRVRRLLTVETVDLPLPDHRGGLVYLKRAPAEEQKAIYREDRTGAAQCLLSLERLGRDTSSSLAILQVAGDGRYLVFAIRVGGEDAQEIALYDLDQDRVLPDRLPRGLYRGLVFAPGNREFYYAHEETAGQYRDRRAVRRHMLGSDSHEDVEVYHAGDGNGLRLVVQAAEDSSALGYLLYSLESPPQTRFLVHPLPIEAAPREILHLTGAHFAPRFRARMVDALTTLHAPRGRLVRFSLAHPECHSWRTLVSPVEETIDTWETWRRLHVLHAYAGDRPVTRIVTETGEPIRLLEYPVGGTVTRGRIDSVAGRLFYAHSDLEAPPSISFIDLRTGVHHLWWSPSCVRAPRQSTRERHLYRSNDGVEIPITLVRSGYEEGNAPVLVSAYGAGGVRLSPRFSVLQTILVEAGFTCAVAHVRGGGDAGVGEYAADAALSKQTSVDDLIAAARWLIREGYCTPRQLGVAGQSAGALLALCSMTQEPHLFGAVMALGPLADLTRFHLFGVARSFVAELGSPDNPEALASLRRLSPYHQIQPGESYPAVLILSGDSDKRCDGLHARKMIARLKSVAIERRPILLDYVALRGHKPVLPLAERIRALADRLTFLIAELHPNPQEALR